MPSRAERHATHARAARLRVLPPLAPRRRALGRERRRAAARAQILTAAAELFRERGYRATTLEDLARRLGMSKATVYGHFPSKDELLAAIFHRTMSLVEGSLAEIRRRRAPAVEQLRAVIRHHVRIVVAERAFLTVFFAEDASLRPRLARAIVRRKARYDRALEAIVRRGIREGALATPRPRLLVWAILGMSNWVYRWYSPRGPWDADAIADGFLALLEPGLLRRRAPGDALARRLGNVERELRALRRALRARVSRP